MQVRWQGSSESCPYPPRPWRCNDICRSLPWLLQHSHFSVGNLLQTPNNMEHDANEVALQSFDTAAAQPAVDFISPVTPQKLLYSVHPTLQCTTTESERTSVNASQSEIEADLIEPCMGCHGREAGMTCTWCGQHKYCSTNCMNACVCRDDCAGPPLCAACAKHPALSNTRCPGCGRLYCSVNCGMSCECGVWD